MASLLRYILVLAATCALAVGFQNCSEAPPMQNLQPLPSQPAPIVPQLCEELDTRSCLTRSQCQHTDDTPCTEAIEFVGTKQLLARDHIAPVLLHPEQSRSLWASADWPNVHYQWYKSTGFFNFNDNDEALSGQTEKHFQLPACSAAGAESDVGDVSDDANGDASSDASSSGDGALALNAIAYYYAQASYDDTKLQAPFMVACVESVDTIEGRNFKGLSAGDSLSHEAIERLVCSDETCEAGNYKAAGDLIVLQHNDALRLRASVKGDVHYQWYYTLSPNTELDAVAAPCASGVEACVVQNGNSPATGSTLQIEFDRDDRSASACDVNRVVYFHAVASQPDNAEYKKQAVFRVACIGEVVTPSD